MEFAALREDMVDSLEHDTKRVVEAVPVGDAMRTVPRHQFVEEDHRAYMDQRFTHRGSTILSPSLAGRLLEALEPRPGQDVLVVGSGVGYTVGVLAEIAGSEHVHAVDISRELVLESRRNLRDAGYDGVLVDCRDGAEGFPEYAPFDRILVEAAAVEPPTALLEQLTQSGRLVIPLGGGEQHLVAIENGDVVREYGPVGFDPLLVDGEQYGAVIRNRTMREERERAVRARERRRGWEHEWIDWENRL